jgi:hypothetical protein
VDSQKPRTWLWMELGLLNKVPSSRLVDSRRQPVEDTPGHL